MEADFKKGDREITLDELIGLIKNHEYSKFIIEGLGETTIENVLFKQMVAEYEANKHYIELGKAVEKAFNQESCILFIDYRPNTEECFEFELTNSNDLLEWAEGRE